MAAGEGCLVHVSLFAAQRLFGRQDSWLMYTDTAVC